MTNLRVTGFLFWPGNDGLRPYERRRMAREAERRYSPPTAAQRQQHLLDTWRDLPAPVCVSLMGEAPEFYFAVARWAAHLDSVGYVEALTRGGRRTSPAPPR